MLSATCQSVFAQLPKEYKGKPYKDSVYVQGAQNIPGRVELAYYDLGGEGLAYHDTTPENEGFKILLLLFKLLFTSVVILDKY